jgi:signal transduction histidine kinase
MPGFNQYAYMLEGFDKDWVYCGNRREASYTNLDPGKYTFRVKGCGREGVWNEAGSSMTVIVNPALWQTWWFRLLTGGGAVVVIAFVYRREVTRLRKDKLLRQELSRRQIESQEEERKRLAAELHDGLGQDLLVMNNEIQQFLQGSKDSNNGLNQVASLLQESIEGVREIASNLHPHLLERLGFSAAVEAMVEKVSHSSGLTVCRMGDTIDKMLPKEIEIHLYRIIQEALSNVVHHASARNASVRIKKRPTTIEIIVMDDGRGFNIEERRPHQDPGVPDESDRGIGLSTMTERTRIIGGRLKIESSRGSGTTVHVILPCS